MRSQFSVSFENFYHYIKNQMSEDRVKVLQVRDLAVKFQAHKKLFIAVNRVSFAIDRGETLCLVGESGSGKTTLALAVVGLLNGAQVEGNVVIENRDVYSLDDRSKRELLRQKTSFIFQDPVGSLVPGITIVKQLTRVISFRLSLKDRDRSEHRGRQLLQQVGLENTDHVWSLYPHQLSGGMCQRVMIAMALSVDPVLVIADEPISALDALTQEKILELLTDLQKVHEFGMLCCRPLR
jgi:microcin C transport system ATP-binding protein